MGFVGALTPGARAKRTEADGTAAVPGGPEIRRVLRSEAIFLFVMILLFACLFTSMTSFQTTYAGAQGLDYSIYYMTYTAAVIFSRFVLAGAVSRFDARLVIAVAVSAMALAVTSFLFVGSSVLVYGVASGALGLGYGLALPTVQAHAVNISHETVRPRVLPIAGLVFQAAFLGFPLIAGWIIVGFGYQALFAVLLSFVLAQAAIGWWRFAASRSTAREESRSGSRS
jgi:MFS family permease